MVFLAHKQQFNWKALVSDIGNVGLSTTLESIMEGKPVSDNSNAGSKLVKFIIFAINGGLARNQVRKVASSIVQDRKCSCGSTFQPVCGINGKTFINECTANCENI